MGARYFSLSLSLSLTFSPSLRRTGREVVFVDTRTGLESSEHPLDPSFRNIFFREKEAERLFEENEWRAVQAEAELLQQAMLEAEQSEILAADGGETDVSISDAAAVDAPAVDATEVAPPMEGETVCVCVCVCVTVCDRVCV